jgi:hypothetical protein
MMGGSSPPPTREGTVNREQLAVEWQQRAAAYECAARLARRDGDPDAADDYQAAADDYYQAARELELGAAA